MSDVGQLIMELRAAGESLRDIAKKLGCSKATVSKYCSLLKNNDEIRETLESKARERVRSVSKPRSDLSSRVRDYHRNRQIRSSKSYSSAYNMAKRKAINEMLNVYANCCSVCGSTRPPLCKHHVDPKTKLFSLSGTAMHGKSPRSIFSELNKCSPMCAICHTFMHSKGHLYDLEPLKIDVDGAVSTFEEKFKKYLKELRGLDLEDSHKISKRNKTSGGQ